MHLSQNLTQSWLYKSSPVTRTNLLARAALYKPVNLSFLCAAWQCIVAQRINNGLERKNTRSLWTRVLLFSRSPRFSNVARRLPETVERSQRGGQIAEEETQATPTQTAKELGATQGTWQRMCNPIPHHAPEKKCACGHQKHWQGRR